MGGEMKKICIIAVALSVIFAGGQLWSESVKRAAPQDLANITRAMKSPGFWITRHPFPDRVILDPRGIRAFNENLEKRTLITGDPSGIGPYYPGEALRASLEAKLKDYTTGTFYNRSGAKIGEEIFQKIRERMAIELVDKKVEVRHGVLWTYADQRELPTDEIMTKEPLDAEFDELQNNSLDIGTPLAILHETSDHEWVYTMGPSSSGWVYKEYVAFCSPVSCKRFESSEHFVVVTSPKADIYLDGALTVYHDFVRMGTRLASDPRTERGAVVARIPYYDDDGRLREIKGFIKREDVNFGYLAYTPRAIIEQAFKLLNAPYGWGSAAGEQDCSAFIQMIFATVGITMPRNSQGQGEAGYLLGEFTEKTPVSIKLAALAREAVGGITTLKLKGHIMLFLGMHEKRPYAIHATYIDRSINRVVISDLELGKGSKKGSLLERLTDMRLVADKIIKGK